MKLFTNENRRLKIKLGQNQTNKSSDEGSSDEGSSDEGSSDEGSSDEGSSDEELDASNMLVQNLSPAPNRQIKLSNSTPQLIRRRLRLNRVPIIQKEHPPDLCNKVQEFLMRDINSVVVPDDKKAEKGLRNRIPSLNVLCVFVCQEHVPDCSYPVYPTGH